MIINHNMSSINANRMLGIRENSQSETMNKLASGERITRAGDDASNLAVSEKMRAQTAGLQQAAKNAENGISFIQTTEGYLNETSTILGRIRELSIQSANGIYTSEDRMQIQVEVSQLIAEVDRIASHAQFNGMNMLTGAFASGSKGAPTASMWFHIGSNADQRIKAFVGTMTAAGLGVTGDQISLSTPEGANKAIGALDSALTQVNKQRADLGAYQNRLEELVKGVNIAAENIMASESRIRDADIAAEMVNFTRDQILSQASVSMLAQANAKNQAALRLIG